MAFSRPSLTEIIERVQADIDSRLPGADSRLRRSPLDVLAKVEAGVAYGLYGYLDWISKQALPDQADAEQLQRWVTIWGLTRKAATAATGLVTASGANASVIPAGSILQRGDLVEYVTTAEATITGGSAALSIEASTPGAGGIAVSGVKLSFTSPIEGVNVQATVGVGGLAGGADEELDEDLRARLLARIRQTPAGGAATDYERWTLEVPGVTRAWVYPNWMGAGTVGVTFVLDGREDIIPEPADVDQVAAYLEPLRPVTAQVVAFAPLDTPLNMTLAIAPATQAVRDAIEAEIRDLLFREAEPGGTLLLSHLREAISTAAGETDHRLFLPASDVEVGPAELLILGNINWSEL